MMQNRVVTFTMPTYYYFFSLGYGTGSSRKSSYVKQPLLQQRVNLPVHYGHGHGLRGGGGGGTGDRVSNGVAGLTNGTGGNQVVGGGSHVVDGGSSRGSSSNHHTETMTGNVGSSSTSSGGNSGDERWYDLTSFVEFRVHLEFKIIILKLINIS